MTLCLRIVQKKKSMRFCSKKKEIDDKIPKLRTEDETKTLRSLFNKMRKFPKDLIAEIKNKFPSLQRKPKTAEQRKEQIRIIQAGPGLYGPAPSLAYGMRL